VAVDDVSNQKTLLNMTVNANVSQPWKIYVRVHAQTLPNLS